MENFEPQLRKDFLITYSPREEGFRVKQDGRRILKAIPTLEKAIAAADELAAGKETAAIAPFEPWIPHISGPSILK